MYLILPYHIRIVEVWTLARLFEIGHANTDNKNPFPHFQIVHPPCQINSVVFSVFGP